MVDKLTIVGDALPNIPWEEKPKDAKSIIWRSARNPIIPRDLIKTSNSIFNSAVVPYKGEFIGVFRCDDMVRRANLHTGRSKDGYTWVIEENPIQMQCDDPEIGLNRGRYDPRVVWIDDRYWIMWCNGYHGPTIGLAYTHDFEKYVQIENAFLPCNRNGVLFPRKINGKYVMLSRPSDHGHTPFGDIFTSESPDMTYWGRHRFMFGTKPGGWESVKVGPGPVPIETSEGWLMIYHGVQMPCSGFCYSMGVALLDLDEPWKIIARSARYLMNPQAIYEWLGDTHNVVFPVATLCDAPSGRLAVYYGAADTVVCLAYTTVQDLVAFAKEHHE